MSDGQLKRFDPARYAAGVPQGTYAHGLPDDVACMLGHTIAEFAHLEMEMMEIMAAALGDLTGEIAQPTWAALQSNRARARLTRSLLQSHPNALDVDGGADALLGRFEAMLERRNEYVHGLWRTRIPDGQIWLNPRMLANGDHWFTQPIRQVTHEEIEAFLSNARQLQTDVVSWVREHKTAIAKRLGDEIDQELAQDEQNAAASRTGDPHAEANATEQPSADLAR